MRKIGYAAVASVALLSAGCTRYVKYGAVDGFLRYQTVADSLNDSSIPFDKLRGHKVSLEVSAYGSPEDGRLLKDIIKDEFAKQKIDLVQENKADLTVVLRAEVSGENTSRLWIPLIYSKKKRSFFVKLKTRITDKATGDIIYEKECLAKTSFSEYSFLEVFGPVKKYSSSF